MQRRDRSRSPLRREVDVNLRPNLEQNLNNLQLNMAQNITAVEIQVLPKFTGDSRELPLFISIIQNFYDRHLNQNNQQFLVDIVKTRLEGDPLRIIAGRNLNTLNDIFVALREMYGDPRTEMTLELDIINYKPKSSNMLMIGQEIRELVSYYESKINSNAVYTAELRENKIRVIKNLSVQSFIRSLMLINRKVGEYVYTKDPATLDTAVNLAQNHVNWLDHFDQFALKNKVSSRMNSPQINSTKNQFNNNQNLIATNNPGPMQYFIPQNLQQYNENFNNRHFSPNFRNSNNPYSVQNKSDNKCKPQPMEIDPSQRFTYQNTNFKPNKKPLMGFQNGKRIFNLDTDTICNEIDEDELNEQPKDADEVDFEDIVHQNFREASSDSKGT